MSPAQLMCSRIWRTAPEKLAEELVAYIDGERVQNQALQQENNENEMRLAEMEEEMAALDERLGGATEERAALIQRLEAQARVKEQFEQVEKMFTPAEARVFREGNNIILRLVGLTFDSGNAQVRQETFGLLGKVEQAIDVFPRSEIIIEGHTDSLGGDESNQKLSQTRAEAVQQYMINAMRIPTYRLIATGYGETRPIASNETESGRQPIVASISLFGRTSIRADGAPPVDYDCGGLRIYQVAIL